MRILSIVPALAMLAAAAPPARESVAPPLSYADIADLALAAPVAAEVRVTRAVPVRKEQAVGVRAGFARLYVEAEVVSLIRAPDALPSLVRYLADLPAPGGKALKLAKGAQFLLFAAPVPGRPGELRLIAQDAQVPDNEKDAAWLRAILREAGASRPPVVTGVGRAFHVAGSLPGESETQIFLQTADGRPVSLNVLRRPGETPRWSVALSEIVDDAAAPPAPETLLWYRLACGLPRQLPQQSLAEAGGTDEAEAIHSDYAFVLGRLGPCVRTRRL
jgi:hypothetical protein